MKATMAHTSAPQQPWYKEPWPWILMAGPGVVVVAGVITVWLAIRSNDGLVVDDYYKQGLAVNQELHRDQAATARGLHAELTVSGEELHARVAAADALPLAPTLIVKLFHPTRAGHDQTLVLTADGPGQYSGRAGAKLSGRWIVTLEEPSSDWRLQGEWWTDAMEPLRLGAEAGTSTPNQPVTGR